MLDYLGGGGLGGAKAILAVPPPKLLGGEPLPMPMNVRNFVGPNSLILHTRFRSLPQFVLLASCLNMVNIVYTSWSCEHLVGI